MYQNKSIGKIINNKGILRQKQRERFLVLGKIDNMQDELENRISKLIENQKKQRDAYLKKYPDDPPNNQCKNAYIKGLLIENSFEPRISEINKLFETNYETVYVWTYEENKYSVIVIDVDLEVKELPIWKNIGSVIWLALQYTDNFQWNSADFFEYKWMYYLDIRTCVQ